MSAVLRLQDVAVLVDAADNVAVVKADLDGGETIRMPNGSELVVTGPVTRGNRFATRPIPAGSFVLQYGQPIGTAREAGDGIGAGDPIDATNMSNDVPISRELPDDLANPAPNYIPVEQRATFAGFRRADGRVGTRNYVAIVPTSMCSSHEAQQIATIAEFAQFDRSAFPNVDGIVALPHNLGCGSSDGSNIEVLLRTLANCADHPNVGGVIFIELGCEKTNLDVMDAFLARTGRTSWDKPTVSFGIQQVGGTQAAIERGLAEVQALLPRVNACARSRESVAELVLGVKCGGSDGFSGLSANPALGHTADRLIRSGGTVLITEVPEFCGAEHLFAARAKDAAVGRRVFEIVDWYKAYAAKFGTKLDDNPSPGNIAGGLLNITIKSLGAMAKAGTTRVEGTCAYAERPSARGLHLMQGPGYDQESTPGLVAAGATVVVFTTGRGTTIGNALAPVIKLASNSTLFARMERDIDLNAGGVIDGTHTIEQVGVEVFEHMIRVAGGQVQAKAEVHKHREFQVWAEQSVSL